VEAVLSLNGVLLLVSFGFSLFFLFLYNATVMNEFFKNESEILIWEEVFEIIARNCTCYFGKNRIEKRSINFGRLQLEMNHVLHVSVQIRRNRCTLPLIPYEMFAEKDLNHHRCEVLKVRRYTAGTRQMPPS